MKKKKVKIEEKSTEEIRIEDYKKNSVIFLKKTLGSIILGFSPKIKANLEACKEYCFRGDYTPQEINEIRKILQFICKIFQLPAIKYNKIININIIQFLENIIIDNKTFESIKDNSILHFEIYIFALHLKFYDVKIGTTLTGKNLTA
jgi:hypothetical protein